MFYCYILHLYFYNSYFVYECFCVRTFVNVVISMKATVPNSISIPIPVTNKSPSYVPTLYKVTQDAVVVSR